MEGAMVWWVVGVLLIVASVWLYRRGLRLYAKIGLVLAIAALLTGFWTQDTAEDGDLEESPTVQDATPDASEGGV